MEAVIGALSFILQFLAYIGESVSYYLGFLVRLPFTFGEISGFLPTFLVPGFVIFTGIAIIKAINPL